MKRLTILTALASLFLAGCGHYNYAVKRDGSPVPYKNKYADNDNNPYEFYSTLYEVNADSRFNDLVEITHLNDVYNSHQGTPESTWRKSFLSFNLSKDSGVELIPESVVLEHYSEFGERIMPSKVESTVSKCSGRIGCNEYIVLHYEKGMPEKLVEKVSFKLIVNGKERTIWRKSFLSFNLSKDSGVELIPESVVLEHYSEFGERIMPSKVESTVSKCSGRIGCNEYIVLHYEKGMPEKLVEKVSFKLIVNGKERTISYTLPLEYKYQYSFWDVMMGV